MQITLSRADGLHILTKAALSQMAKDDTLLNFADGLLSRVFKMSAWTGEATVTLAETLHHPASSQINALLTVLLVLDAEVNAVVDDKPRVFPLPGFLSYRSHLPPKKYPLNTLRLPPLNPDGHYIFTVVEKDHYLAVRMDIHPKLKVTGHIRIAIGGPTRPPQRMPVIEHRLARQVLDEKLIEAAIAAGCKDLSTPLTEVERTKLGEVLRRLSTG